MEMMAGKNRINIFIAMEIILIGLIMSLPTGSIYGIPLKIVLLAASIIAFCIYKPKNIIKLVVVCIIVFSATALWLAIGMSFWGRLAIREFQMIFVPILVSLTAFFVMKKNAKALLYLIAAFVFFCFFVKFFTCLFFYFGIRDFDGVFSAYVSVFGAPFVGLVINNHLMRVFLSSDMAVAMVPLFILISRGNASKKLLISIFVMSAFTVFVGYSRSVWGVYALSCLIFFGMSVRKNGWIAIIAPIATVTFLQLVTSSYVYDGASHAFSRVASHNNDDISVSQVIAEGNDTSANPGAENTIAEAPNVIEMPSVKEENKASEKNNEIDNKNIEGQVDREDLNNSIFYQRFLKFNNELSDGIRAQQASALWGLFLQHPVLGVGLGGYDVNLIRSATEPYSYELQLFSLLPKLGIVGSLILTGFIVWCFIVLGRDQRYIGMLVLAMFLVAGMLNPYLFSSSASLVYLFMMREVVMAYKREPKNA